MGQKHSKIQLFACNIHLNNDTFSFNCKQHESKTHPVCTYYIITSITNMLFKNMWSVLLPHKMNSSRNPCCCVFKDPVKSSFVGVMCLVVHVCESKGECASEVDQTTVYSGKTIQKHSRTGDKLIFCRCYPQKQIIMAHFNPFWWLILCITVTEDLLLKKRKKKT